ncbi:hypothetical protein KR044_011644 [Drosophila immigrans]|nr:hypothetical protein KR044_011644 [Drosophila immigrans]
MSAFVCTTNERTCKFITDKYKRPCPKSCRCTLDRSDVHRMRFDIDCSSSTLHKAIPELPIPMTGNTSLIFDNSNLKTLPTRDLYGYSEVKELHLNNNQLSTISVDQLPINITYLDLRNNRLEGLNKQVLEFLWNRSSSLSIKLSGNPWICKCAAQSLIQFHLEVTLSSNSTINDRVQQYLTKYKKLKIIEVPEKCEFAFNRNSYKISAFICVQKKTICQFISDKYSVICPFNCHCGLDRSEMRFDISCQYYNTIRELPIPIIGNTSLKLNNNRLTILPSNTVYGYSEVRELHLANNKLSNLTVDQLPLNLTYLDLRNNRLEKLDEQVLEFLWNRSSSLNITLSGNPWICKCETQNLIHFALKYPKILDRDGMNCSDPNLGQIINIGYDLCDPPVNYIKIIITIGVNTAIIALILVCCYYKQFILLWLFENGYCLRWISRPEPEEGIIMKNDAFIAFSHVDLEYAEEFVEAFENGAMKYKVCYYHRDWLPGQPIPECILTSIEESKRTIILMTEHFMKSSWGRFEFRSAIKATSNLKHKRLIVILYSGVDTDNLDSELKSYLKYNTYLSRDDPNFWRKLMFAMPHNHTMKVLFDPKQQLSINEEESL